MWEQELGSDVRKLEGVDIGDGWILTWTVAVILLILFYRLLGSRFLCVLFGRGVRRGLKTSQPTQPLPSPSPPLSSTTPPLPLLRSSEIISDSDLKYLLDNLNDISLSNDGVIWENVCKKSNKFISYEAKCCKPKDEPLKYASVTTFEDISVEVLVNFYMDNQYRMIWDKTVVQHEQLQMDHDSGTEIGRTIKKFPFLTPREYVLAWKLWKGKDGSFYCFSKECEHHSAPRQKRYVRVGVFRSGWKISKVPGRNSCEIRMVHQEDAGLNVEMAKMAFSKGVWSFVCKMGDALQKYSTGKQLQLNSTANVGIFVQTVPPEYESEDDNFRNSHTEKSTENIIRPTTTGKPNLTKRPSKKMISNGLIILGGILFMSRGHANSGINVGMAYLFSKFMNRGASSTRRAKPSKASMS